MAKKELDNDEYLEKVIKPIDRDDLLDKPLLFLVGEIDRLNKISERGGDFSEYWDYMNDLQDLTRYALGIDDENEMPEWFKENVNALVEDDLKKLRNHRHKLENGLYSSKPEE